VCYPKSNAKPTVDIKDESKYIDVPWTDERIWNSVKDKVRDMIEDWTLPRVTETVDSAVTMAEVVEEKTYRERAKELGITTFGKKKEAVLVEIANEESRLAG